jgi:hypothetical protein
VIGPRLREEQIARTLERHECAEGTELLGIESHWDDGRFILTVKEPQVGDRRGVVRRLLVPVDVLEMSGPEPEPRRGLLG